MTLTEFLLARIAEDELVAEGCESNPARPVGPVQVPGIGRVSVMGREGLLAECEAKRRIVERAGGVEVGYPSYHLAQGVLSHLAAVYADHPDYRDEWKP